MDLWRTLFFGIFASTDLAPHRNNNIGTSAHLHGNYNCTIFLGATAVANACLPLPFYILPMANRANSDDPYASSSFIGHSLWVCPTGATKDAYSTIIKDASTNLDTFCFTPHITLVAAIMTDVQDVVKRTKLLASKLAPYEFEYEDVSQKERYFQSVFARMKGTEQVLAANQLARDIFTERQTDPEYMPHLSLIYGNFSLEKKQRTIMPQLSQRIQDHAPATTSFTVDSIEIWSTQGDVSEWYLVETVPLTGK